MTSRGAVTTSWRGAHPASKIAARLGSRFFSPPADALDLPDYAHLEP